MIRIMKKTSIMVLITMTFASTGNSCYDWNEATEKLPGITGTRPEASNPDFDITKEGESVLQEGGMT